jgi:cation diffusion facilitator family transporter
MTSTPASITRWSPQTLMKVSVVVALATIAFKTLAWWLTDSVGLLSDALESLVNLASAVFGLAMVSWAAQPADDEHPYGHHKAEYFSSGFEGVLIVVAALAIIWVSVHRWMNPTPLEQVGWGMALNLLSSACNGWLAWVLFRAAKVHQSIALEADGRHLITDVWTSAGVVVGLAGVMATGWHWLDPLVGILVALNILREGAHLLWRSSQGLMDQAVDPEVRERIDAVLGGFSHARGEHVVIRFDHISTRKAGQRMFVDLHMHMPASWTLGRAAALRTSVEQALMDEVPGLRASIQLLPSNVEAHLDDPPDVV